MRGRFSASDDALSAFSTLTLVSKEWKPRPHCRLSLEQAKRMVVVWFSQSSSMGPRARSDRDLT